MGLTVTELLARTTSAELTEWQAYEVAYGPVGPAYRDAALADLIDAVQRLIYVVQAVQADPKDRGQIPQDPPYIRPHEWAAKQRADTGG